MSFVGNKLHYLRHNLNISREEAGEIMRVSAEELAEIEIYSGDYYYPELLRICKLYQTTIIFLLDDNSRNVLVFNDPSKDEYFKFDEMITCVSNLRNPLRKDFSYIKRPACCNKPGARYYGWKILDTEFCFKGTIVLEDVDEYANDDIMVAIVKQKPVYGRFKAENGGLFIAPINDPKKRLSLTAKGSRVMGLVKYPEAEVN